MDHVPDVVDTLIAHRLGRHERIAAALGRRGEGTVDELLPEVYGDVTERQLPVARFFSLWAHLRALGEDDRESRVAGIDEASHGYAADAAVDDRRHGIRIGRNGLRLAGKRRR